MCETLKIAVCEDQSQEQMVLSELLGRCSIPSSPIFFSDAESFLKAYRPGSCDLILMDIYMAGMSGVEAVARIRSIDQEVPIAFMTTSPDFAMEGYRYRVDRYLLKPLEVEDLSEVLHMAMRSRKIQPLLSIIVQGRERTVPQSDISYAEQHAHTVYIHLTNDEILKSNMKLSQLSTLLPSPPFYQFHKSFLVNLTHVRYLDTDLKAFVMNSGCAYIRRESLREAQSVYSRFMFDQIRNQEES